uniref:Uncharacterized protein n=1 Tax=Anguilla anguilla TaxID=7936 RepID=A0A0E9P9F1_ANGAN
MTVSTISFLVSRNSRN